MANSVDPDELQLIWIYTVCKDRVYPGSAGQGLKVKEIEKLFSKLQNPQITPGPINVDRNIPIFSLYPIWEQDKFFS